MMSRIIMESIVAIILCNFEYKNGELNLYGHCIASGLKKIPLPVQNRIPNRQRNPNADSHLVTSRIAGAKHLPNAEENQAARLLS